MNRIGRLRTLRRLSRSLVGRGPAPNSRPVITVPGAQDTPWDTPLVISGISVADADDDPVTVTVAASSAALTFPFAYDNSVRQLKLRILATHGAFTLDYNSGTVNLNSTTDDTTALNSAIDAAYGSHEAENSVTTDGLYTVYDIRFNPGSFPALDSAVCSVFGAAFDFGVTSGIGSAGTFSVTSTVAALNLGLDGLLYSPTSGDAGSDTLTVDAEDAQGGTASQKTVAIDLTPSLANLAAYYKCSNVNDSSGNARTLTNNSTVTFGTGKLGNAANFDASNYLSRADESGMSLGDIDFYMDCWFKINSTGVNHVIACKAQGGGASDLEFTFRINTSNRLVFGISNGVTDTVLTADTVDQPAITAGVWHFGACWHLAGSDTIGIRVNGAEKTGSWANGSWDSTFSFFLGSLAGILLLNGSIDDFAYYVGRALSSAERDSRYNSGDGRELL